MRKLLIVSTLLASTSLCFGSTGNATWHPYHTSEYIAASRHYPCNSRVRVTYKGKSVVVRIKDWGPAPWTGNVIDLSRAAFTQLAPLSKGRIKVTYKLL